MVFQTILLAISLALGALLGFSAHRASICSVKAVEEVLTTRRAYLLASFGKTVLWTMAVTMPLLWLVPETRVNETGWPLTLYGLAGGLVFGVGAACNGGCAFSTLTRLGSGQLSMLLTLAGFGLGVVGHTLLDTPTLMPTDLAAGGFLAQTGVWSGVLLVALLLWGLWEARHLWHSRPAGHDLLALALADRYRLSTAALLIGISNAVLYALHGNWAYTSTLARSVRQAAASSGEPPGGFAWLLFLSVIVGIVFSAWQRRSFQLRWRPNLEWSPHLIGGTLMGLGAALVPGGNDALLLHGIPWLSPHAIPAYLAMLLGIALALTLMHLGGAELETVRCSGDVCRKPDIGNGKSAFTGTVTV